MRFIIIILIFTLLLHWLIGLLLKLLLIIKPDSFGAACVEYMQSSLTLERVLIITRQNQWVAKRVFFYVLIMLFNPLWLNLLLFVLQQQILKVLLVLLKDRFLNVVPEDIIMIQGVFWVFIEQFVVLLSEKETLIWRWEVLIFLLIFILFLQVQLKFSVWRYYLNSSLISFSILSFRVVIF